MANILVVDDQLGMRQVLTRLFKIKGIQTLEAESGEQALQVAGSQDYSAALVDVGLPGMGGLTVLEKLLEMHPATPVVMMSGNWDDEKVNKVMRLGASGILSKPFDFSELESAIIAKIPCK